MQPKPTDATLSIYRAAVLDPALGALRQSFCRTVAQSLANTAGWLGCDSFLGFGDVGDEHRPGAHDADRYVAFRATAAVIEMASELAGGAVVLLDGSQRFAASALIRQLLETEYLLTLFSVDFGEATRWAQASPDDIRRSFSPKRMRSVGGFSNDEYWKHCSMGGHPAPAGRPLLQHNLAVVPAEDPFLTASVWSDLAQHLRRLWTTTDELLRAQHARYDRVRESDHQSVRNEMNRWTGVDPLSSMVDFALLNELAGQGSDEATG